MVVRNELPYLGLDLGSFMIKGVLFKGHEIVTNTQLVAGDPVKAASLCLSNLLEGERQKQVILGYIGANAYLFTQVFQGEPLLEIEALQAGLSHLNWKGDALLSLGHENMYYLEIGEGGMITFFNRNSQCAAGSGSFWYQQATRMGFNDKELAKLALEAEEEVRISGRCAVFAKSDMTHAINEGATQASVCAGMAKALSQMIITSVAQNRIKDRKILSMTGGVANNQAVMKYITRYCQEASVQLNIPPNQEYLGAIGAAIQGKEELLSLDSIRGGEFLKENTLPPLPKEGVHYLDPPVLENNLDVSTIYLGVDCGSVSTKGVLLDGEGHYIGGVYLPTAGKPALQVLELMKKLQKEYGDVVEGSPIVAVTTGSGRFLSQKILKAQYAVDEITCQGEGVKYLCGDKGTFSIIEIGGEDSKFLKLQDGVLFDYNMNPVCAAGTGTFLENLAGLLGVKIAREFSEKAFEATYAIDLGDTCTLLSQSTLVAASSRGLPLSSQLASLAISSARNYMSRTVESRPLEGKIIFTGATAKNRALASAFAFECKKEIFIPPYPELTGALGGAVIAQKFHGQGKKGDFSFDNLENFQSFTVSKEKCKATCDHEHNCSLDIITFKDKSRFLYGDRCNRYSGLDRKDRGKGLPDYQKRREEIFYERGISKQGGQKVGIARGGLFFDLYPFWAAFFQSLDFEVVLSDVSSEETLEKGKEELEAEMCYPMEVLLGHYQNLWAKGVDYLFLPEVVDMEPLPWALDWPRGFTCPLLQTSWGFIQASLQLPLERILYAQLNYRGGEGRIQSQFQQMLEGLNYSKGEVHQAVRAGYKAQKEYSLRLSQEGERMMEELKNYPEKVTALFLGRSYTLYDEFISKGSLHYARQRGLLAIPSDLFLSFLEGWYNGSLGGEFLSSEREEFQKEMLSFIQETDNIYPIQVQRIISSVFFAQFLNQRREKTNLPLIHFVIQDPFKCGPNAMLRHILGNMAPYLRLTLDEHTAPAGMITRLEAFMNTCSSRNNGDPKETYSPKIRYVKDTDWNKVLIPTPTHHSRVFATLFGNYGVEAKVLPMSQDQDLSLAKKYVNGDECLPMIQNVQDFLDYLAREDSELAQTVFFQGWACGPCRYGLYAPAQSLILHRAGYGERRIVAVKVADIVKRFGIRCLIEFFDGLIAMDLLYKMLHSTRPYEKHKGESQNLFSDLSDKLISLLKSYRINLLQFYSGNYLRPLERFLEEAAMSFQKISKREEKRPRIILAGEFYVRLDPRCNQGIIEKIELAGGEVLLSPASEVFTYTAMINYQELKEALKQNLELNLYLQEKGYSFINWLSHRDERRLEMAAGGLLYGQEEPSPAEIQKLARDYVSSHYGGEPPMTIGRTAALARRKGVAGAVFVAPFTCLPGLVVESMMSRMQEKLQIPIISIYYDGKENANREEFIKSLVFQAKQKVD